MTSIVSLNTTENSDTTAWMRHMNENEGERAMIPTPTDRGIALVTHKDFLGFPVNNRLPRAPLRRNTEPIKTESNSK